MSWPSALQPDHISSHSVGTLGAGSDYAPFIHFLGISSMDIAYTYDRVSRHPLVPSPGLSSTSPLLSRAAPVQMHPSLSSCATSTKFLYLS